MYKKYSSRLHGYFFLIKLMCFIWLCSGFLYSQDSDLIIQNGTNGESISLWVQSSKQTSFLNSMIIQPIQKNGIFSIISNESRCVISQPLFNMNFAGQGIAVWQSYDAETSTIYIEASAYSSSLGWSVSKILSDVTDVIEPSNYSLKLDEHGYFSVFWNIISSGDSRTTTIKNTLAYINDFYE